MLMNLKNFTLRSERLLVIALLACSTPHAFAISMVSEDSHNPVVNQQDTHVKGTVIDSRTGEPIIGANIVVKGTTNGTITGVDGDYSLKAPVGSVLEISFIGYKTVTVKAVAGLQKIRLQEDSSLLDEVVVVGYGTQKKTLSKILCKWKQDSAVSLFLYLDSVFKNKHKLIHNQAPVMNRLCPFLLNLHK